MADGTTDESRKERAPLGSWSLLYTMCCIAALGVMVLLYWFSTHFNVRLPS